MDTLIMDIYHKLSFPAVFVAYAGAMVFFTLLRLTGHSKHLMPHQLSIALAVVFSSVTSILAATGDFPMLAIGNDMHALLVFFPQQMLLLASLRCREEINTDEFMTSAMLLSSITALQYVWIPFSLPVCETTPVTMGMALTIATMLVYAVSRHPFDRVCMLNSIWFLYSATVVTVCMGGSMFIPSITVMSEVAGLFVVKLAGFGPGPKPERLGKWTM